MPTTYTLAEVTAANRNAVYTLAEVSAAVTFGAPKVYTLAGVSIAVVADVLASVDLGPDVTNIEPHVTVTITATVTGGTPSGYRIQQTLGPDVPITGNGPVWTYESPGLTDTTQLRFAVTALDSGGNAGPSAEVDHFVYPDTFSWVNSARQRVAARFYT